MNIFSMIIIFVAFLIATIRIIVLFVKLRKREKEIAEYEALDRVILREKIDDLCLRDEVKNSLAIIFGMFIVPLSCIEVLFNSYAGDISKAVFTVSIFVGYYFIIREIENRQV